eukprot:TRINITY_DN66220_c0_g1_i1.p1 TRINITY_DN66220_c0_g1~~TRINITY_DN66220_c0_g1_i1.p1  ORF type:complete len:406 (-),score=58.89 TRINITY_DN66220_c0_g1_i1:250-1428(-)
MASFGKMLGVLLCVGIAYVVSDFMQTMAFSKEMSFNDSKCHLLNLSNEQVEDLSALGDGHSLYAGGGDLWTALHEGSKKVRPGTIWLINVTTGRASSVSIDWETASPPKLVPHGIFYSQRSKKLYVVSHDEESGESVEVFATVDDNPLKMRHITSVHSPFFGNLALNDVVEGIDDKEFYVTEWLPFAFPIGGKRKQPLTPIERLQKLLVVPLNLLKFRITRVFRCKLDGHCEVASGRRWIGANGIAVSRDRQYIFVNDPAPGTVTILHRQADGSLKELSDIKLVHSVDNIEVDDDGLSLQGGSIPQLFTHPSVCEEGLGSTREVDGRKISCGHCPGGLLRINISGTVPVAGAQKDVLMHDGSKLSTISSAIQVGSKVVIGSPNSPGALLCEI